MGRRPAARSSPSATLALCHEWLAARSGSEKTFEAMAAVFPDADLYGLTWNRSAGLRLGGRAVKTTFLDRFAPIRNQRALQLPLMPLAWRYASRRHYDVVVTSSHACAKGFWPARDALHLCYCYTPMRYLWLRSVDERRRSSAATAPVEHWLRSWDRGSASWVDEFVAISAAVSERIEKVYGRRSEVIHPPVDTDYFTPTDEPSPRRFALAVSRMVPYKGLDVAIRACHRLALPLVVAGSGPAERGLRTLAGQLGAEVRFVISPTDGELRELYRAADLVVFPAEEDFGMVPVEAQACGTPVVANRRGGAIDTVIDGVTGVLVPEQDDESFSAGIESALNGHFSSSDCRRNAKRFSRTTFQERFLGWVVGAAAARGIELAACPSSESV